MSESAEPAAWRFDIEHMDCWRTTVTLDHPEEVFADHQDVALRNVQPLYPSPDGEGCEPVPDGGIRTHTRADAALAPDTVWVVTARREDSPHCEVRGVYETERAAQAHRDELANNCFAHGVVAWSVHERLVRERFDAEVDR